MSATRINGVSPLMKLSKILPANDNVNLELFTNSNNQIKATFTSKNSSEMKKLNDFLSSADLKDIKINYKTGAKKLVLSLLVNKMAKTKSVFHILDQFILLRSICIKNHRPIKKLQKA